MANDLKITETNTKEFVIWFAGFYEAEGCVCNDRYNRNMLHVSVTQNDRAPLDLARKKWGGSISKKAPFHHNNANPLVVRSLLKYIYTMLLFHIYPILELRKLSFHLYICFLHN
jgi:hypothetical protein